MCHPKLPWLPHISIFHTRAPFRFAVYHHVLSCTYCSCSAACNACHNRCSAFSHHCRARFSCCSSVRELHGFFFFLQMMNVVSDEFTWRGWYMNALHQLGVLSEERNFLIAAMALFRAAVDDRKWLPFARSTSSIVALLFSCRL